MQIQLTGHHIEITPALREFVESKLQRVERHFDDVIDVHVILGVVNVTHTAEATLNAGGTKLFAEADSKDMYAAIDDLVDKLDRQVKKHKEKQTERKRGSAAG